MHSIYRAACTESRVSLYYVVCKMLSFFALKFLIVSSVNGKDIKPKTLSQYRKSSYISVWTHLGRKCRAKSNNTHRHLPTFLTAWIFEPFAVHVLYLLVMFRYIGRCKLWRQGRTIFLPFTIKIYNSISYISKDTIYFQTKFEYTSLD